MTDYCSDASEILDDVDEESKVRLGRHSVTDLHGEAIVDTTVVVLDSSGLPMADSVTPAPVSIWDLAHRWLKKMCKMDFIRVSAASAVCRLAVRAVANVSTSDTAPERAAASGRLNVAQVRPAGCDAVNPAGVPECQ